MSDSPPADSKDVEQNAQQSGEEQDNNDRNDADAQGPMTDFEVKEQDRWLPIANGMIMSYLSMSSFLFARVSPATCVSGPVRSRLVCDNAGCF